MPLKELNRTFVSKADIGRMESLRIMTFIMVHLQSVLMCLQRRIAFLLLSALQAACVSQPNSRKDTDQMVAAIRAVMEAQQAAWNRGDIEGFMNGYERSDTTTFVSGDEITRGWQTVLDRYKQRYSSPEKMGTLSFSELEIQPVSPSYALADGRWQLNRAGDSPHGRFTLLLRETSSGWRIIHDTTTSAAP
jgi:ketosteroid isomerase-like protein